MSIVKVLHPVHTSFESAYEVNNYPYGGLRTSARFWIETKKNFGQRVMFCTLNPKTRKWNNPKKGNYYIAVVLFIDENNHCTSDGISEYDTQNAEEFLAKYESGLQSYQVEKLWIFKALHTAQDVTGKTIYNGYKEVVWGKAKELLNDWGKGDLIKKIV